MFTIWLGIISGAILQLQEDFNLNCNEREIIIGIMLVGAVVGSIIGGKVISKLSKRSFNSAGDYCPNNVINST